MKKILKKYCSVIMILVMVMSMFPPVYSTAAKNAGLKKKTVTLKIGGKSKIKIKNKKKKRTYKFKSNKPKIASVSKSGTITAKKKGKAVITVREVYRKNGRKTNKRIGTVKVSVKTKQPSPTNRPLPTNPPSPTPTAVPTPPNGTITDWKTPFDYIFPLPGISYGVFKEESYFSNFTQSTKKCNVLLPANYTENKKYPVLYLLHGYNQAYDTWVRDGQIDYIIGNLIAKGDAKEMIVVIPDVRTIENEQEGDAASPHTIEEYDNFIYDLEGSLMPFIEGHYSVSTKRADTAIAGLSMGGKESLLIGFRKLNRFGYIGAFSSAPGLGSRDLSVKAGEELPRLVLVCVGTEDDLIGFSEQYHQNLTDNNIPHLWYTMPGGHDYSVWKNGLYNFAKRIFK